MVGIWGHGGIGKTTIAEKVYERNRSGYKASAFIRSVREEYKKNVDTGHIRLQKHLYEVLLKSEANVIETVDLGNAILKQRLSSERVLLILDDVDALGQIEALVGKVQLKKNSAGKVESKIDRFGPGSRIIVTTRYKNLTKDCKFIYEVEKLTDDEGLEVFCSNAFKQNQPPEEYEELARGFVEYADGLPLALGVLGSLLADKKCKKQWSTMLKHLKENPENSIIEKLKLSYDAITTEGYKDMFLDIACFFKGEDESRVSHIFNSCGFDPDNGIADLIDKSLITKKGGKLWMHDFIQRMGWDIVRREDKMLGKRSRLWRHDDALRVLEENTGTEAVEAVDAVFLTSPTTKEINFDPFLNMKSLRLLKIASMNFSRGREYYLSRQLRLLEWHGYPLKSIASTFESEKLVELIMPDSKIEKLWKQSKRLEHLVLINLRNCQNLTKTPDFSFVPKLERLILEGCKKLSEVHPSIGKLDHLILLDLKGCKRLQKLCQRISLRSLETLILSGCSNLKEFPEIKGDMKNLSELHLDRTTLSKLPVSINRLTGLSLLSVSGCKKLLSLSSGILCGLTSLKRLVFTGCLSMDQLPEDIGMLENLEKFLADETAIRRLPSSILELKNLKVLSLRRCGVVQTKPWKFPFNFFGAGRSDKFKSNVFELPDDIGRLSSLQSLDLSENNFRTLPESISQLSSLTGLYLIKCRKLESLPKNFPSKFRTSEFLSGCSMLPTRNEYSSNDQLKGWSTNTIDEDGAGRQAQLSMDIEHADQLLAKSIQGKINDGKQFELRFPYSDKNPNWCTNLTTKSRIEIKLASEDHEDHQHTKTMKGFLLFVGFAIKKHEYPNFDEEWESKQIFCQFQIDKNQLQNVLFFENFKHSPVGLFGLCCYVPVEWFAGNLRTTSRTIEALIATDRLDVEIHKFGIRQMFEHDVEHVSQEIAMTANEHDVEWNFVQHCKELLDGANKLERSGDITTIESSRSIDALQEKPPNEVEHSSTDRWDNMIASIGNNDSLHSLLSSLFQGRYARHNVLQFNIPFPIIAPPWFFHHSVGNIAVCYLPSNLSRDKRWVGLELYVAFNLGSSYLLGYLASEVVLVDLYAHGCSTSQPIFCHQLKINIGPNFVVCHVPQKYFPRELNQFEVISAFIRATNPDVEVKMCGTRLLYEQDSVIFSEALIASVGQTLDLLRVQAKSHQEAMEKFLQSGCESDNDNDGDDQCNNSIKANQVMPQSTYMSSSESREWNYTTIIKSLEKLLSSTEQEAANHGVPTSLNKMYYSVREAVAGSDGVLFHSKRSALENLDRYQESDENALRDLPTTIPHLHIIGETLLCSNESEKQIKERCIALLRDILEHCVLTTLSLRGHTVFASKGFDPAFPYNLCFPQKEIPEWFDHYQCRDYMVGIELPPNLGDDSSWRGLVICASFSIHEHPGTFSKESFRLLCHLTSGGSCLNPVPQSLFTKDKIKWLHLRGFIWLTYVPRVFLMELNGKDTVEARVYNYCPGLVVKECGIRLLYQPDVERLRQMIIRCCTSFVENLDPIYRFLEAEDDE